MIQKYHYFYFKLISPLALPFPQTRRPARRSTPYTAYTALIRLVTYFLQTFIRFLLKDDLAENIEEQQKPPYMHTLQQRQQKRPESDSPDLEEKDATVRVALCPGLAGSVENSGRKPQKEEKVKCELFICSHNIVFQY